MSEDIFKPRLVTYETKYKDLVSENLHPEKE